MCAVLLNTSDKTDETTDVIEGHYEVIIIYLLSCYSIICYLFL